MKRSFFNVPRPLCVYIYRHTHTHKRTSCVHVFSMGFRFDFFWTPARLLTTSRAPPSLPPPHTAPPRAATAPCHTAVAATTATARTTSPIVLFTASPAGSARGERTISLVCECTRAGRRGGGASVFTHRLSRRLLFSALLVFVLCCLRVTYRARRRSSNTPTESFARVSRLRLLLILL